MLVIYPTESSYAIGGDARDADVVRAIFQIKGRAREKNLPVICASLSMVKKFFRWRKVYEPLARRWWPGPLTIIMRSRRRMPVSRTRSVAVRVSAHPVARVLSHIVGAPFISTSANKSGKPSCFSVGAVVKQLGIQGVRLLEKRGRVQLKVGQVGRHVLYLIDVGRLPRRIPSTIVRVEKGTLEVVRAGAIRQVSFKVA